MARIRTIKPEFPQSESMGRVSRDARLCFVQMWTIADDEGRLRGASRMLASLLFPYDDDAPALMEGWLCELAGEGCIYRYQVDGTSYIQIAKWLEHQKIDRPSKSKFPAFDASSRKLANDREASSLDLGPRTKEKDQEVIPPIAPPCAEEENGAVTAWNVMAAETGLPRVQHMTEQRRVKLRQRLKDCGGLVGWSAALDRIRGSPFLLGQNKDGWRADFDFVLQSKSFTKLMEGAYDGRKGTGDDGGPSNPFVRILAEGFC